MITDPSSAPKTEQNPSPLVVGVSLALIGIALFFRVWHLGNIPGLNGDEAEYGVKALNMLHGHPEPLPRAH